jgi:hypothetical protein
MSSVQHNVALLRRNDGCFATVFRVITADKFACSFFMLAGNICVETKTLSRTQSAILYLFNCDVSFMKLTALFIQFE